LVNANRCYCEFTGLRVDLFDWLFEVEDSLRALSGRGSKGGGREGEGMTLGVGVWMVWGEIQKVI